MLGQYQEEGASIVYIREFLASGFVLRTSARVEVWQAEVDPHAGQDANR